MKKSTIKLIIIFSSLSLTGLIVTQLYWVNNAYKVGHEQYDHRANRALNDVIDLLSRIRGKQLSCSNQSVRASLEYDSTNIFNSIDTVKIAKFLAKYVDYHKLDKSYEYAIIQTDTDSVIYASGKYPNNKNKIEPHKVCLSCLWDQEQFHLAVFFPEKNLHVFLDLSIWFSLSALFLLIVIMSFTYIILTIIRQKKLSEIKNDFINNMTHEFKTPISTISVASEVLMNVNSHPIGERTKGYAEIIYEENQRMRMQVDRVLQMAVIDKGEFVLNKSEADIHELLKSTVHNLCLDKYDKPVNIIYKLKAMSHTLNIDIVHITNIISNLVDNAIKYSTDNPEISIATKNEDNEFVLSFIDKGIGIAPESVKHVFDKFYRVPTGNRHDVKGFGLGLYYVKTMIEAHNGRITLQSELNKGSHFSVFLPMGL